MKSHQLSALVATMSVATANAAPPPDAPLLSGRSIAAPPVEHIELDTLKIVLEETTLGEIAKSIGAGKISHQEDAGESQYWLCYADADFSVWLISGGEMGGSEHAVTRVVARRTSPASDCTTAARKPLQLSINGESWLSRSMSKVAHVLGRPSATRGLWTLYSYEGRSGAVDAAKCQPDGFDLSNWLAIESRNGTVTEIQLGQISSC